MARGFRSFSEFWPYYLSEHSKPGTRALHFIGTTILFLCFIYAVWFASIATAICGIVAAYAFAWIGHFVIERNVPATFRFRWYSAVADLKMWGLMLFGRVQKRKD